MSSWSASAKSSFVTIETPGMLCIRPIFWACEAREGCPADCASSNAWHWFAFALRSWGWLDTFFVSALKMFRPPKIHCALSDMFRKAWICVQILSPTTRTHCNCFSEHRWCFHTKAWLKNSVSIRIRESSARGTPSSSCSTTCVQTRQDKRACIEH